MAGGAPVPVPTFDLDEKILSIKDLERVASKRLERTARGKIALFSRRDSLLGLVIDQAQRLSKRAQLFSVIHFQFSSRSVGRS